MTLGLYDFGDGGREAKIWQRRHKARALRLRKKEERADEAADLKKRRAKWRQACAEAKRLGLKRPRPPRHNLSQVVNITGQRFGRLTVIKQAPASKNRGRNRCCYVKCDCPRRGVYLVAQTTLRRNDGKGVRSCGCLVIEAQNRRKGIKRPKRAKPLSVKLLIAAGELRQAGNKRLARLLELSAPAVRVSERRRARRQRKRKS